MNEYDAVALSVALCGSVLTVLGWAKKTQTLHMRVGKFLIGACCLSWGLLYFSDLAQAVMPRAFDSEAEFLAMQKDSGFLSIGKFNAAWPATYVDELTGEDELSFVCCNGTPQHYSGFAGYRLKIVRLQSKSGAESIYVLRSSLKH